MWWWGARGIKTLRALLLMKVPFEIVAYYAEMFLIKACTNGSYLYLDLYHAYIDSCGWSDVEFDLELLRRVDENWDLMYN